MSQQVYNFSIIFYIAYILNTSHYNNIQSISWLF